MTRLPFSIRHWLKPAFQTTIWIILCLVCLGLVPGALANQKSGSSGETIVALTTGNRLVQFSSDDPCTLFSRQSVSGLQPGERLHGIDFRPFNGQLYGLGSTSRLYVIDPATAVATQIGVPFPTLLDGTAFGFDFNPTVDRIRVVSNTGQNMRLHPDTGAIVAVDLPLAFASVDPNAGVTPVVAGAAYTNPDNDPLTGTTLYDIDSGLDILATQNPPNDGILNTVGSLGIDVNKLAGFDISISGMAYVALQSGTGGCGPSQLALVDLTTGSVTLLDAIGTSERIRGLAVPTQ
jgi:hypothetical protein